MHENLCENFWLVVLCRFYPLRVPPGISPLWRSGCWRMWRGACCGAAAWSLHRCAAPGLHSRRSGQGASASASMQLPDWQLGSGRLRTCNAKHVNYVWKQAAIVQPPNGGQVKINSGEPMGAQSLTCICNTDWTWHTTGDSGYMTWKVQRLANTNLDEWISPEPLTVLPKPWPTNLEMNKQGREARGGYSTSNNVRYLSGAP